MSIVDVTRELLVRYLDTWTPTALHTARRATFAQYWAGPADVGVAEAALRVFAEFTDRLRGRRLAVVLVAPETDELAARLDAVQAELGTPPELSVHTVAGDRLAVALKAAGAAGAPGLAYLHSAAGPAGPTDSGRGGGSRGGARRGGGARRAGPAWPVAAGPGGGPWSPRRTP